MTDTNQLPPSEREAFEAFAQNCPMGKYSIARRGDGYDSSHTQLMWDAWQARAQVQGELEPYDAGLLNDFGGGNVEWWQDYIRAELGRAHDFYQSQITTPQSAQATQAEVTDGIRPEDFTVDVVVKSMGGFAQINTKGVRVTHKPTGISVTCDAARSQHANRQQAFEKLSAILAQQPATGEPVKSFAELREKHRPGIDAERAKLDATKKEPS